MSSTILKKLAIAAMVMALMAVSVFAQEWDTAYIPIITNVDATVLIQPLSNTTGVGETRDVAAGTVEMFTILLDPAYSSATHRAVCGKLTRCV
jgi:membrane-associated PAP2 superfamily phosphatase